MDNTKLNELAAKAMGWALNVEHFRNDCEYARWVNVSDNSPTLYYDHISQSVYRDPQFEPLACRQWRPSTCADDALVLLEKVAVGSVCEGWDMEVRTPNGKRRFAVDCGGCWGNADTAPLAMTLCALRAAGISETEIADALK